MIGSFKATSPQPRRKVALNGSCWETAVMRSKALTSAGLVSFLAAPLTCWQLWASHLSQPHLLICKLTSMSVPSSWSCFWVGGQGEKWEALNTGPGIQILFKLFLLKKKKKKIGDFPGGPVVKNPACNARDVGSIPGQGTNILHGWEQLSPHTITRESMSHNERFHIMQRRHLMPQLRHNTAGCIND